MDFDKANYKEVLLCACRENEYVLSSTVATISQYDSFNNGIVVMGKEITSSLKKIDDKHAKISVGAEYSNRVQLYAR